MTDDTRAAAGAEPLRPSPGGGVGSRRPGPPLAVTGRLALLRRHLRLHQPVRAPGPAGPDRRRGAHRGAEPRVRQHARAGLRTRRRPAQVRRRRPSPHVPRSGPSGPSLQRGSGDAQRTEGGGGRADVGRPRPAAHVRRHPQRRGPPLLRRAVPPRARHHRTGGQPDRTDGARGRAGRDRRERRHPGRPAGRRRRSTGWAGLAAPLAPPEGSADGSRPVPPGGSRVDRRLRAGSTAPLPVGRRRGA